LRIALLPATGFLRGNTHLIHDRDPLFTKFFDQILRTAGLEPVKLPPRSPNLNAYAERFVRSIKSECLDRMIFFGEGHLRHVVEQYVEHYHAERNHQGLNNRLITSPSDAAESSGYPVASRERLGGMLRYYHRRAA
jgi:transposase InsO family protein